MVMNMVSHTSISIYHVGEAKAHSSPTFSDIFSLLSKMNFIHEQKKKYLIPNYDSVQQTWNHLLSCPDNLAHHTMIVSDTEATAICSSWRASKECWIIQNGIASNIRDYINTLVLESSFLLKQPALHFVQAWFNPENRIVNKMCGKGTLLYEQNGTYEESTLFLHWEPTISLCDETYHIDSLESICRTAFQDFIIENRSWLFYESGDFSGDPYLKDINTVFMSHGLFRHRFIDVVHSISGIDAIIISYFSSPGISFSFLENCTEIIVNKNIELSSGLFSAISEVIRNRTESWTAPKPIITDRRTGTALIQYYGATLIRKYSRRIWTKEAYGFLYDYILAKYC